MYANVAYIAALSTSTSSADKMGKFNEVILSGVVVYMALDIKGLIPSEYKLLALNAQANELIKPYIAQLQTHLLPHLSNPYIIGAVVFAVLVYLAFFRSSIEVVKVPALSAGPISQRVVESTALQLPNRPGLIQCYSPSTLQFLGEVPITSAEGVKAAVARTRALQPAWAATTFAERRRVLRMMSAAILAHEDEIVRISCIDTGKPRVDAQFGEILSSLGKLDWVIKQGEAALRPEARATNLTSAHKTARVEYHPLGVIGAWAMARYLNRALGDRGHAPAESGGSMAGRMCGLAIPAAV